MSVITLAPNIIPVNPTNYSTPIIATPSIHLSPSIIPVSSSRIRYPPSPLGRIRKLSPILLKGEYTHYKMNPYTSDSSPLLTHRGYVPNRSYIIKDHNLKRRAISPYSRVNVAGLIEIQDYKRYQPRLQKHLKDYT